MKRCAHFRKRLVWVLKRSFCFWMGHWWDYPDARLGVWQTDLYPIDCKCCGFKAAGAWSVRGGWALLCNPHGDPISREEMQIPVISITKPTKQR